MKMISVMQNYGIDRAYYRATIPKSVANKFGLTAGTVLDWSVLDDQTLMARVVE